jgi:hypothetical protein
VKLLPTALFIALSIVIVAPKAEAACRYASDYDSAGRRCGGRSAEMRGPTTGYDGDGGWSDSRSARRGSAGTARSAAAPQVLMVFSRDGSMNLRATANGAIIRSLKTGSSVTILGTTVLHGKLWNKVRTASGETGFVLSSGLMLPETVATLIDGDKQQAIDAAKRKARAAEIDAEVAAYRQQSKAEAAAWVCSTKNRRIAWQPRMTNGNAALARGGKAFRVALATFSPLNN